jgi:two-component system, NtrC family, response regulator HydG
LSEARIIAYLGLALVGYLIAELHSLQGDFDAIGMAISLIALGLAAVGPIRNRFRVGPPGSGRIAALGFLSAVGLLGLIVPHPRSITVIAMHLTALCGFGSIVGDLALSLPEGNTRKNSLRRYRVLFYLVGAVAAIAGLTSLAPAVGILGPARFAPSWLLFVPPVFAAVALFFALIFRSMTGRLAEFPEKMASNNWARQGLFPLATVLLATVPLRGLGLMTLDAGWYRGAIAVAAVALVGGHTLAAEPRFRLASAAFSRVAITSFLAFIPVSTAVTFNLAQLNSPDLASRILSVMAIVAAFVLIYWVLKPSVWRALAPAGGRLLEAVTISLARLPTAVKLEEIAQVTLLPLREASRSFAAEPLLYTFFPDQQLSLDAAGVPHATSRALSSAIREYIDKNRGEIILRDSLQASIVRQPPLRPLVDALVTLDALCVVPLVSGDDLEGALIVPKAARRSPLTSEEIEALRRLSRQLVAPIQVFSALARAEMRENELTHRCQQATGELKFLQSELTYLRAEAKALKTGKAAEVLSRPVIAYSSGARALLNRINELAANANHAFFITESGIPVEPLAYLLHASSSRAEQSFVIGDCAATSADRSGSALFGQQQGDRELPGWLQLALGGSLLLLDVPALPIAVQRSLAWALATRQAQVIDGQAPYSLDVRIIATVRAEPDTLVASGALDAELSKRLEEGIVQVPPLRERREDIPSLVLLEIDRACRVYGREPVGIKPEALEILQEYEWPGNLLELSAVIEQAILRARTNRITPSDISLGTSSSHTEPPTPSEHEDATFSALERRILEQAMTNAGGNKSKAARMLGLKRTTFLDKLKRYQLESDKPSGSG